MKEYFGNYLGMVISNSDPEYRGRVQVFIPHVMPALYEGWNKDGTDIQISCVGSNIPEGLSPEIHARLMQILPWAEAASPIVGGSSPGNLTPAAIGQAVGGMIGGALGGAAGQAVGQALGGMAGEMTGRVLNQEPTTKPSVIPGELGALYNEASKYVGTPEQLQYQRDYFAKNGKYDLGKKDGGTTNNASLALAGKALVGYNGGGYMGACGRGTAAALGAMTGNAALQGGSAGGNANDYSIGKSAPNDVFAKSGLYNPKVPAPSNYAKDPSQWRIGDVIACDGGTGFGHIQTYVGVGSKPWTSDTPQAEPGMGAQYKNCALIRATPEAQAKMKAKLDSLYGQGATPPTGGVAEDTGNSADPALVPPIVNPEGQTPTTAPIPPAAAPTPQQGGIVPTQGAGQVAGTVSGGGTVSQGIAKLATDRQAKFANELNDPAVLQRLSYLAWQEVDRSGKGTVGQGAVATGTKFDQQANFIETVVNRAQFSGRSLTAVLNESAYGFKPGTSPINPTTKQAFDAVMGGRNNTSLATDNASNQREPIYKKDATGNYEKDTTGKRIIVGYKPNPVARNRINGKVTGNWFRDGKVITDPTEIARLTALDETPNGVEFFYTGNGTRESGYFSKAGLAATEYAKQNGIEMSSSTTGFASSVPLDSPVSPLSESPSVVNNTDPGGLTSVYNTNDMAKGMFSYPNPGAMVWVFFREGNPLYPVYFAASYSAREWSSVYKTSSESPDGMAFGENGGPMSRKDSFNLDAGCIYSLKTVDYSNPFENKSVLSLQSHTGSNLSFANGQDQLYSRQNRRDQVDRDRFETTMGFKEQWVEGDYSINVRGDYIIKVGKIDQESLDALQKMADYSSQINAQLAQSSSGGGGSSAKAKPADAKVLEDKPATPISDAAVQKAVDEPSNKFVARKLDPVGLQSTERAKPSWRTKDEPQPTPQVVPGVAQTNNFVSENNFSGRLKGRQSN